MKNFPLLMMTFALAAAFAFGQSIQVNRPAALVTYAIGGERIAYLSKPDGGCCVCTSQFESRIENAPAPLVQTECNQSLLRAAFQLADAIDAGALGQ